MTPPPAQFDIYEVHTIRNHIVTPEEAAANAITIPDIEAHAVVIADAMFARAYGELSAAESEEALASIIANASARASTRCPFGDITCGELIHTHHTLCHPLTEITSVTYSAPDTTVAFSNITEGEQIDLFIPIASAPPLLDVQFGISHDLRFYDYEGDCINGDGRVFIQSPIGNDDLKNFIASLLSEDTNAMRCKTWLLNVTCVEPSAHDVFFEVLIAGYGFDTEGQINIEFVFELPQDIHDDNTTPCPKTPHIEATMTAPPKPRSRLFDFLLPSQ